MPIRSVRRKSAAAKMAPGRSQNPTWSGQFVRSANGQASLLKSASDSRKATSIIELEKSPHTESTNENADHAWKYQKSKRLGRLELLSFDDGRISHSLLYRCTVCGM